MIEGLNYILQILYISPVVASYLFFLPILAGDNRKGFFLELRGLLLRGFCFYKRSE